MVDTTFDQTFTAVPDDGYEFIRWIRAGGHLYGCNTNPELRISTANLDALELFFNDRSPAQFSNTTSVSKSGSTSNCAMKRLQSGKAAKLNVGLTIVLC